MTSLMTQKTLKIFEFLALETADSIKQDTEKCSRNVLFHVSIFKIYTTCFEHQVKIA